MDDLTKEFLLESGEGLDRMERCLAEMRKGTHTAESIAEVFRAVHTIKGTVGFLGFPRLERLAHAGEHLLALVRDGRRPLDASVLTWLVRLMDRLRAILQLIESAGTEGSRVVDHDAKLIERLERLANVKAAPGAGDGNASADNLGVDQSPDDLSVEDENDLDARNVDISGLDAGKIDADAPDASEVDQGVEVEDSVRSSHAGVAESTLRVGVATLNRLMNLVGDLVQTRNQMLQIAKGPELQSLGEQLDSVTTDLRNTVMQARMQPVEQLFLKFPRLVREIAQVCGKSVRLETSGGETGLDKSLLEALKDPLTHAVRNAIDHGIESPEERLRLGKPATGVLHLRAFYEGGHVVIELTDDGGGIDCKAVRRRAVERGIVTAERARAMTDAEATELVFGAGFSTRDEATLISGRGVGMDVVRANVEHAGGTAELESVRGEGTTLRMRVPLTLAIVPALVVHAGGMTFALPRNAVLEMMTVYREEEPALVQSIGQVRMFRLRDRLIPLLELSQMLGLKAETPNGYYIAVLEAQGRPFGLIVDDIAGTQEIVVKPLSKQLRRLNAYCGATLLGDGSVALILDAAGLARMAQLGDAQVGEAQNRCDPAIVAEKIVQQQPKQGMPMLLFKDHAGARSALPLEAVERVEYVPFDKVETIGRRTVIDYLGDLLPLHDPGRLMESAAGAGSEAGRLVVICRGTDANVRSALVVREVLDVAEAETLSSTGGANLNVVRMDGRLTALCDPLDGGPAVLPAVAGWKEAA